MNRRVNGGFRRNVFVWGTISVLIVGCLMVIIQSGHASEIKGGLVSPASTTKIESPGIPPIDAATPSIIETASFGLG